MFVLTLTFSFVLDIIFTILPQPITTLLNKNTDTHGNIAYLLIWSPGYIIQGYCIKLQNHSYLYTITDYFRLKGINALYLLQVWRGEIHSLSTHYNINVGSRYHFDMSSAYITRNLI